MKRILIVEDIWTEYEDLRIRLENEGFVLGEFTKSYEEAKTQIESFDPHLILLDIDLFGPLNGFDVAELIDAKHAIPYIFLSSYSHREFREKALKTRAKNFLVKQKPISIDQLLVAIEFALEETDKSQIEHSGLFVLPLPKRNQEGTLIKEENDKRVQKNALLKFSEIVKITKGQGDLHHKIIMQTIHDIEYCHTYSLKEILEHLPESFIRVERGAIVNLDYLSGKSNGKTIFVNGKEVQVGTTFIEEVKSRLGSQYLDI